MTSFPLFRLRELHLGVGVRPEEESKGWDGMGWDGARGGIFEFDSDVASSLLRSVAHKKNGSTGSKWIKKANKCQRVCNSSSTRNP